MEGDINGVAVGVPTLSSIAYIAVELVFKGKGSQVICTGDCILIGFIIFSERKDNCHCFAENTSIQMERERCSYGYRKKDFF